MGGGVRVGVRRWWAVGLCVALVAAFLSLVGVSPSGAQIGPTLTVTPDSELVDGQLVDVTATEVVDNGGVDTPIGVLGRPSVAQCDASVAPLYQSPIPSDIASASAWLTSVQALCSDPLAADVPVPGGVLNAQVNVAQPLVTATGNTVDCDVVQCVIVVSAVSGTLDSGTPLRIDYFQTAPIAFAPLITASDVIADPEGNSGSTTVHVPVSLSQTLPEPVTVDFQTVDDTASAGSDYTATSGTVTFAPGETEQSVPIEILGDTVFEPDETGTVEFSNPSANAALVTPSVTFTIVDDDDAILINAFDATADPEGDIGSSTTQVRVTLFPTQAAALTVDYQTADDTATAGTDYVADAGTLTFAAGETEQFIDIEVLGDPYDEGTQETFTVTLSNPSPFASFLTDTATVTIVDDDDPVTVTVGGADIPEGDSGSTTTQVPVTLSRPLPETLTADYRTVPPSEAEACLTLLPCATPGVDFAATSGTITFLTGETTQTIPIEVFGDTNLEGNEFVLVEVSNFSRPDATQGFDGSGFIVIIDDEPVIRAGNISGPEGDTGSTILQLPVTLSPAQEATVTVDYQTADDTATASSDYTATSGTLTFAAGETEQFIDIEVLGDTVDEQDERGDILLSNASPGVTITDATGVFTINDDDDPVLPPPVPVTATPATGLEDGQTVTASATDIVDNGGLTYFGSTIGLYSPAAYQCDGAVVAALTGAFDFGVLDANCARLSAFGEAPAGDFSETVSVQQPLQAGNTNSFSPSGITREIDCLSNDCVMLVLAASGELTDSQPEIIDSWGIAPISFAPVITPGAASVVEGDVGTTTVDVPVTLSATSAAEVTVDWTTFDWPGTAESGTDYVADNGTVTFAPGETDQTVTITINGDTEIEPGGEYGLISFTNLSPNATLDTSFYGLGVFLIQDDDTPTITPGGASVVEGNVGTTTVDVPVTLSKASTTEVTVDWTTFDWPGTAESGTDYVADSGTVTFAPGETDQTVTITINGDTEIEPGGEYGLISFTNPSPNATLDTSFYGLGAFLIQDDD